MAAAASHISEVSSTGSVQVTLYTSFLQHNKYVTLLTQHQASVISLTSVLIAAAALIVAIRAQRANYRLARQMAQRVGRLANVTAAQVWAGNRDRLLFKVLNGPDEITIDNVRLRLTYGLIKSGDLRGAWSLAFYLRHTCFELLGIKGRSLPLRLAAYDQALWELPRGALPFA